MWGKRAEGTSVHGGVSASLGTTIFAVVRRGFAVSQESQDDGVPWDGGTDGTNDFSGRGRAWRLLEAFEVAFDEFFVEGCGGVFPKGFHFVAELAETAETLGVVDFGLAQCFEVGVEEEGVGEFGGVEPFPEEGRASQESASGHHTVPSVGGEGVNLARRSDVAVENQRVREALA